MRTVREKLQISSCKLPVDAKRVHLDTTTGKRPKKNQPFHSGGKPHALHTLARARYVMSWRRYQETPMRGPVRV